MSLVKLFNDDVTKTTNSEAFQTDDMYALVGTHVFGNQLESARATYYTIAFMPHEDCERNKCFAVNDTQVKHHLQYLCANTSAKDEDEIYPVTASEIL